MDNYLNPASTRAHSHSLTRFDLARCFWSGIFFAMLKLCHFNVCVCRFFLPLIPLFVDEHRRTDIHQIFFATDAWIAFDITMCMLMWWASMCMCEFSRMEDFCHLDASSHTRSHMRVVSKTELCCVCNMRHCHAVLFCVCTKRQSVFTLSLSLRLNYVMWHCKCECITESHIHPSKRLSIVRLSLYCWSGTNIAEFAIYMAFALPPLCYFCSLLNKFFT